MGELFERYDVEPIKGEDITIGDRFPLMFVSETDEVFVIRECVWVMRNIETEHRLCIHTICAENTVPMKSYPKK